MTQKNNDPVSHPHHYNQGKIEVIEFLEDQGLGFHLGNAVKYIARAGKKNPEKTIEDLEKAVWYIQRQIECLAAAKFEREKIKPNDMPQGRIETVQVRDEGWMTPSKRPDPLRCSSAGMSMKESREYNGELL